MSTFVRGPTGVDSNFNQPDQMAKYLRISGDTAGLITNAAGEQAGSGLTHYVQKRASTKAQLRHTGVGSHRLWSFGLFVF